MLMQWERKTKVLKVIYETGMLTRVVKVTDMKKYGW